MNSRNNSYWEARTNAIMDTQQLNADKAFRELRRAYIKAIAEIEVDVRKIYNKLKKNGELNDKQVKEFLNIELSNLDRKQLKKLILNTKDDKLRKFLTAKLDAPAYAARIARKEVLKETLVDNLKQIMNAVAINEMVVDKNLFIQNMNESYYTHMWEVQRGMQIGFDVGALGKETIESILKRPFAGGNYSKRIWGNTSKLTDQLYETVLSGLLNGKPLKKMIDELTEKMEVGESAARRLVRTESAYYTNMAAIEGYKECGIEKYRYFAKLDLKVSNICRELDGKIFDIKDAQAGENLPPMHPWCRSSIGPIIDGGVAQRIGVRTKDVVTGENNVIKGDITYKEWYDKYVVDKYGEDKAKELEKKVKNESSDKRTYKKYREILGDQVPKSFEEFRKMKYNNTKEYEDLKTLYKDVNWQIKSQENIIRGSEHKVPFNAKPNSVFDNYKNGELESRRYYGNTGKPRLDIDLTDHGNPAQHRTVPHQHNWLKNEDNHDDIKRPKDLPLTKAQMIANKDILKGD
ncbi:minor capsid protein [Clostridium sp. 1001271B_151109_B4]|uniref:minor capsid protein n=1 Tax=Clostridium sp. 1001271B_151109_B4 TaxID=2787148 RepID=UPI0018AAF1F4|nr:minor capsid protein [Clostridium sp. 1001271B_151109_B4]